jgi:hypothetical protein
MKQEHCRDGYYLIQGVFDNEKTITLQDELSNFDGKANNYGVRNLTNKVLYIKRMASSYPLIDIAKEILGNNVRSVRSVFFDKVKGANWNVAWHQDTSITLKSKYKINGFGPWSEKQGVIHAEPPAENLAMALPLPLEWFECA